MDRCDLHISGTGKAIRTSNLAGTFNIRF